MARVTEPSATSNPILRSLIQEGSGTTVVDRRASSAMSEDYETAREELSGVADDLEVDDGNFLSFDEPLGDPVSSLNPLGSSMEVQRKNGKISAAENKKSNHLVKSNHGIEKSGLLTVLKELTGYNGQSSDDESSDGDASSLPEEDGRKGFARKRTGLHAYPRELSSTRVAVKRKRVLVASILQRHHVVNLTKVCVSEKQLEKARLKQLQKMHFVKSSSDSTERSNVKLTTPTTGERHSSRESPIAKGVDNIDVIGCLSNSDNEMDSRETKSKPVTPTPKPTNWSVKQSLSLSLPKKLVPGSRLTTPPTSKLLSLSQPVSSAKRKLQYKCQVWSSDSDFDGTPCLSQQVASSLPKLPKYRERESPLISTPGSKRKKILSSYSSEEEEVTPLFKLKQKISKEAQVEQSEEGHIICNGDVLDDDGSAPHDKIGAKVRSRTESQNSSYRDTKLGKYEKSPRGLGKEKATKSSSLSDRIVCAACNKNIYWKSKKIHEHPRLRVLVCQKCHDKFNQGTFQVEGENEIYCTLCGDGGSIVCCSFCEHSFCRECIKRHSGKEHLDYLLSSDDIDFKCYVCDPEHIKDLQDTCEEICYYFKAFSRSKKQKGLKSKKYVIDSDSTTARSQDESSEGPDDSDGGGGAGFTGGWSQVGGGRDSRPSTNHQGGGGGGESSKRRGRSRKTNPQEHDCTDYSSGKGSGSSTSNRGGAGSKSQQKSSKGKSNRSGGVDTDSSRGQRRISQSALCGDDDSSSDSMSDGEESSEVNTDDISLSDSSLFDERVGKKKNKKEVKKHAKERGQEPEKSGSEADHTNREDEVEGQKKTKKTKKKRIFVGHLPDTLLDESDFDGSTSGDEKQSGPPKEKKRKRSSDSRSKQSRKKSRLGNDLSSGSGGSDEERLAIKVSDMEMDALERDDSSNELFGCGMSEDEGSQSLKYRTPTKLKSHVLSGSSDSDVVPLRRKSKNEAARKLFRSNSSEEKDDNEVSAAGGRGGEKTKVYKTRSKKRKKGSSGGSSDDFVSDDLSLRGPRLNRKHKRLKLASFLSSDSSSVEESPSKSSGKKEEKGKKTGEDSEKTSTPGHKRKNIRKLIADEKLAKSTRAAQREEEERLERLKKKAKLFAPIEDSERLILEQDPKSKEVKVCEPTIHVHLDYHAW